MSTYIISMKYYRIYSRAGLFTFPHYSTYAKNAPQALADWMNYYWGAKSDLKLLYWQVSGFCKSERSEAEYLVEDDQTSEIMGFRVKI